MKKYIVDLDDLVEKITLLAKNKIQEVELLGIFNEEIKYSIVAFYINGLKITYLIILNHKYESIPIIDNIIEIDDNINNGKITEKDAWPKVNDLVKSDLKKDYNIKFDINLDNIREKITMRIIHVFSYIEGEGSILGEYMTFMGIIEGIDNTYTTLLDILNLETLDETKIPLLDRIKYIEKGKAENRVSLEGAWGRIKEAIVYYNKKIDDSLA